MSWGSDWEANVWIFTYGAESFIRICLHAQKTWLHLFVTEQSGVELDPHDLRLDRRRRALHLVLQVHSLRVIFFSFDLLFFCLFG